MHPNPAPITLRLAATAILLVVAAALRAQSFSYDNMAAHPRLLLARGEEATMLQQLAANAPLKSVHDSIVAFCDRTLTAPTVERKMEGKRLLAVSRLALKRIFYLAYAYRTTGKRAYAARAEQEMLAASAFTDWNPSHFLDVGEMAMALAIGYDWLYDVLPAATRDAVRKAIVDKAFTPSYDQRFNGFLRTDNNWNQVCNAGLVYGALALFEEEREQATGIIERALTSVPLCLKGYAPDGAYPEGYAYWGYGTSFQVMLNAALESALGNDHGLSQYPGFLASARYMEYMSGPSGESFNYADAGNGSKSFPVLYWFARKTNDYSLLWIERQHLLAGVADVAENRLLPCMIIFGAGIDPAKITKPAGKVWSGGGTTPVTLVRTSWNDSTALYLGVKGGTASSSHAHMDAGSFVFDALGERWAMDLGMQNYYSLEKENLDIWNRSQHSDRWKVFRYNNYVHNTLTANDSLHRVKGIAPIATTFPDGLKLGAVVDLAAVLGNNIREAQREAVIVNEQYAQITDVVSTGKTPVTFRWSMTTPAQVKQTSDNTFELTIAGKRVLMVVDAPAKVSLKTWSTVSTNAYDAPNPATQRIGFETKVRGNHTATFRVRLVPQ